MSAPALIAELRALGADIFVEGPNLAIEPADRVPEDVIDRLRAAKPELLAYLKHPPIPKPLVMRDGRRRWSLAPAGDPSADVADLVAKVRAARVTLVADGPTLHITAPRGWQPAEGLAALARNSAAVVRHLHAASDARMAAGRHMGVAMTDPNGEVIVVPAGEPVP